MELILHIPTQTLSLQERGHLVQRYLVSTGANGVGEEKDSEKTPRGWHVIRAKIGAGAPENAVFVGRRRTGEIWTPTLNVEYPGRDWILTRILWLSGLEVGKNRLGTVDTMRRYIYIHGSPETIKMGEPGSRGCIRMLNSDVIELFNRVSPGDRLYIDDGLKST